MSNRVEVGNTYNANEMDVDSHGAIISRVQIGTAAAATGNPIPISLQMGTTAVAAGAPVPVSLQLGTTAVAAGAPIPTVANAQSGAGGCATYRKLATGDTNLATIKNSAGRLFGVIISSKRASALFLKLYNKASNPTLASDVPVMTFAIPANGAAFVTWTDIGVDFSNGIAMACTGAMGDTDTTALTAADFSCSINYL